MGRPITTETKKETIRIKKIIPKSFGLCMIQKKNHSIIVNKYAEDVCQLFLKTSSLRLNIVPQLGQIAIGLGKKNSTESSFKHFGHM